MRRSFGIALVALILALVLPASVSAQEVPQLPARYWGTVKVYKQGAGEVAAPQDTVITAWVDGVERDSITVTKPYKYGSLYFKLTVQGDIAQGSLVEFYVNGVKADQTANFQNNHPEEIALTVEDLIPPVITNLNPSLGTTVGVTKPTISAHYSDALSGVDSATANVEVNSLDVTGSASVTEEGVSYTPTAVLPNGAYVVKVTVADNLGNLASQVWSFTVSIAGAGGGQTPIPTAEEVKTDLFGTEAISYTSSSGEILETIEATSEDGTLTLTIPEGTIVLDKDDNPVINLEADVDTSPPLPPKDASIIGLAYDFGPDGTTFTPPITLTRSYDPDDIPEGVAEEALVLAWYDEVAGEWVELDCVVDTGNNTITASIEHFTTFAIIGAVIPSVTPPVSAPAPAVFAPSSLSISPVEVNIGETVTISLSVTNTGGKSGSYKVTLKINGVVEATKQVTVDAGLSEEVTFTISKDIAGTYSVDVNGLTDSFTVKEEEAAVIPAPSTPPTPTPAKEINWPVLWGVIGGVVAMGLLIFFLARRRTC